MGRKHLDTVIHFRCNRAEKSELEEVARRNDMTLGELMRKGMKTIKVIFGEEITIGDLIIMSDVLKSKARARHDERSSSHLDYP